MAPKKEEKEDDTTNNTLFIKFFRHPEIKKVVRQQLEQKIVSKEIYDNILKNNLSTLVNGKATQATGQNRIKYFGNEENTVEIVQANITTNIKALYNIETEKIDDLELIIYVLEWLEPNKSENHEIGALRGDYIVESLNNANKTFAISEKKLQIPEPTPTFEWKNAIECDKYYVYIKQYKTLSADTLATVASAANKFKSLLKTPTEPIPPDSTRPISPPPPATGPPPGAKLAYNQPSEKPSEPKTPPYIFPDLDPKHPFTPYLVALFYPPEVRKRIRNRLEFMYISAVSTDSRVTEDMKEKLISDIKAPTDREDIKEYLEDYYSTPYENLLLRLNVLMDLLDNKAIDYAQNKEVYLEAIDPDMIQYELQQAREILFEKKSTSSTEGEFGNIAQPKAENLNLELLNWLVEKMNDFSQEGMLCEKNEKDKCILNPDNFVDVLAVPTINQNEEVTLFGSVKDNKGYFKQDKKVFVHPPPPNGAAISGTIIVNGTELYLKLTNLASNANANGNSIEDQFAASLETIPVDLKTVNYLAYLTHLRNTYKEQLPQPSTGTDHDQPKTKKTKADYIKDDQYYPCNYDDPSIIKEKFITSVYLMGRTKDELSNTIKAQINIDYETNKLYYMCVYISLVEFYLRLSKFNVAINEFKDGKDGKPGHKPPGEAKVDKVYLELCSKYDCKEMMSKYGASDFSKFLAIKPETADNHSIDNILKILNTYIVTLEENIQTILTNSEEDAAAAFVVTDELMKEIKTLQQEQATITYEQLKCVCDKVKFEKVTELASKVLGVIKYPDEEDSKEHSTKSGIIASLNQYHSNFAQHPAFNLAIDNAEYIKSEFDGRTLAEFEKHVAEIFEHNVFNTTLLRMYNVTHKHILTQLVYEMIKWCLLIKHEDKLNTIDTYTKIKDKIHEGLNDVLLFIAGYNAFFNKAIYVMLKYPTLQDYYSDDFEPLSQEDSEKPLIIFEEPETTQPTPENAAPAKTKEPVVESDNEGEEAQPKSKGKPYDKFGKYKDICKKIKELLEQKDKLERDNKKNAKNKIFVALNLFNDNYPSTSPLDLSSQANEQPKTPTSTYALAILETLPKDNLCKIVDHFTRESTPVYPDVTEDQAKNLDIIYEKLVTFYETLSGAVRVIVRVKDDDFKGKGITITNDIYIDVTDPINTKPRDPFGPFYRVVGGETVTNETISKIIDPERVIGSLMSGTNVLIFTYGYSGSGKTYTLFGNDGKPGILQIILNKVEESKVPYALQSVTKHYGYLDVGANKKPAFMEDVKHLPQTECQSKDECAVEKIHEKVQKLINQQDTNFIDSFVKSTINNKQSSRGYVFIKFKVGERYLTFVDMAGSEDPYDMLIKLLPTYYIPSSKNPKATNFLTHRMARDKDVIFADVFEKAKSFLNNFSKQIDEITFALGSTKSTHAFKMHQKLLKCFFAEQSADGNPVKVDVGGVTKETCKPQTLTAQNNILLMDKSVTSGLTGLFISVPYHQAVADYLKKNFKYLKAYAMEQILNYMRYHTSAQKFQKFYELNNETTSNNWSTLTKIIAEEKDKYKDINETKLFVSMTKVTKAPVPEIMQVGFTDCPEVFDVWSAYLISQKINLNSLPAAPAASDSAKLDPLENTRALFSEETESRLATIDDALAEVETEMYKQFYMDRTNIQVDTITNLSYIMYVLNVIKKNNENKKFTGPIINKPTKVYGVRYFKFNKTFLCLEASKPNDMSQNTLDTYFDNKHIYAYDDYYAQGYLERIIKEAFYINQANADLVTYFKKQMEPREDHTHDADKLDKKVGCALDYNSLVIESYDQNLCTKPQTESPAEPSYVTNIVKHIKNQTGYINTNTKNIMVCTVRSEPNVKFRHGAIKTLELVKDLKST